MSVVNMLEAKSNLSKLVEALQSGREDEIVIARNGKPAARLVPIKRGGAQQRIGVASGAFKAPQDVSAFDDDIEALFKQK